MVQPLRRAKVGDLAGTAIILVFFCALPLALLIAGRTRISNDVLRIVYTLLLGLAGPLALLASLPLAFFWRKDRSVDPFYLSTATTAHLGIILAAVFLVATSAVLLSAAEIVDLVDSIQRGFRIDTALSIVVLVLLLWIVYLVFQMLRLVSRTQKEMLAEQEPPPSTQEEDKGDESENVPQYV